MLAQTYNGRHREMRRSASLKQRVNAMINPTENKIFTFSTGRFYDFDQVLEFVFVENEGDDHFYYVEDKSRVMFFSVKVEITNPEQETEASLGRKVLKEYDSGAYNKVSWEVGMKGKEIFNKLVTSN